MSEQFSLVVQLNQRGFSNPETDILDSDEQATSTHLARHADLIQQRTEDYSLSTLERAKMHRELFSSFRDLLVRHDVCAQSCFCRWHLTHLVIIETSTRLHRQAETSGCWAPDTYRNIDSLGQTKMGGGSRDTEQEDF